MPRTEVTRTQATRQNPQAMTLLTTNASDVANGNYVVATGNDIVIFRNGSGAPGTAGVTSATDPYGRTTTNYLAETIDTGAWRAYGPFAGPGWTQSNGQLYMDASAATIRVAVIALP
jgi:hypothetical protein